MKRFIDIREATKSSKKGGEKVSSLKVGKHQLEVYKDKKGFSVYIDGDLLDNYHTKKEAEKWGKSFIEEM